MSSPYPKSAFNFLYKLESNHWWFKARNLLILHIMRTHVFPISNFLEVGCGTGFVISAIAKNFPNLQLEASEYFSEGLFYARQRVPRCSFKQLDAVLMDDTSKYDCIGCFDVLEHIESDLTVLSNFYRALRPAGMLLLTVPQHSWLWSKSDDYAHHVRRYSEKSLRHKLLGAGFTIQYCTSFVSLLLPLMACQRLFACNKEYNPNAEFQISPLLNYFLYLIMRFELILLQFGLCFPVGGSLIVLARKQ